MYFSRPLTLGIISLVLLFAFGLLIYIYFQGGVDSAVYLQRR